MPADLLTVPPSPGSSTAWRRLALAAMRKSPCVISPVVSAFFVVGARSFAVADAAIAAVSDARACREPMIFSLDCLLPGAGERFEASPPFWSEGELRPPIVSLPLRASWSE